MRTINSKAICIYISFTQYWMWAIVVGNIRNDSSIFFQKRGKAGKVSFFWFFCFFLIKKLSENEVSNYISKFCAISKTLYKKWQQFKKFKISFAIIF